jgi:hypothetical protein
MVGIVEGQSVTTHCDVTLKLKRSHGLEVILDLIEFITC